MFHAGPFGAVTAPVARWWPAVAYPAVLLAASLAVAAQPAPRRDAALLWASTNLDNLDDHPVRAIVASALLADGDLTAWVVLAAVGLAGVIAAAGPLRAVAVGAVAHLLGTAVSEGSLAVRIARGTVPPSQRTIFDVGPSFVVVGVLVATAVGGVSWWWRLVGLAGFGVLAPSLFEGLTRGDVAALGHGTAVVVGAAAGATLLLARRGRSLPEAGLTVPGRRG